MSLGREMAALHPLAVDADALAAPGSRGAGARGGQDVAPAMAAKFHAACLRGRLLISTSQGSGMVAGGRSAPMMAIMPMVNHAVANDGVMVALVMNLRVG